MVKAPACYGTAQRVAELKLANIDFHLFSTLPRYVRHGLDFVMGTTGGEREGLSEENLRSNGCVAVVAPNMAKQIVAVQVAFLFSAPS